MIELEKFNGGIQVQCPKDRGVELSEGLLTENLSALCCSQCQGSWIAGGNYKAWQAQQVREDSAALPKGIDINYEPALLDTKAALCPECNAYLSRAKVGMKSSFFVERCTRCDGVWCDRGEWEMLEKLGLHTIIPELFTTEWQTRMKERELVEKQRRAIVDKLGEELAQRLFELADLLEKHPNGDFGAAYLMGRFDQ
jgi:Zn-finger nucleic acid-binding protein